MPILLDKEKMYSNYAGLPFRQKYKLTIHIFMVDHRSKSLTECGPTEYPTPEPCFPCVLHFSYTKLKN